MHDLVSRNIGIYSKEEQERLSAARLLVLGCGMGSVVAELAVRTGFRHITLVDGDTVDTPNLNRQAYTAADIRSPKAEAAAAHLRAIDPQANVTVVPRYFHPATDSGAKWLTEADVIVDTMDLSSIDAILGLHRLVRPLGKTVLFPLNLAFGSVLYAFTPEAATLEELLGVAPDLPLEAAKAMYDDRSVFARWVPLIESNLPEYAKPILYAFMGRVEQEGWCPLPQLGIASFLSAALTVSAAARAALGQPLPAAPAACRLDAQSALTMAEAAAGSMSFA